MPRLPIEGIVTLPEVTGMKAGELGVFMSLLIQYWRSGRKALPESAHDLAILGRIGLPQFRQCERAVRGALALALPRIDQAYAQWAGNRANLRALQEKSVGRRRANKLQQAIQIPTPVVARPKRTETQRRIGVEKRQVGAVFVD